MTQAAHQSILNLLLTTRCPEARMLALLALKGAKS